MSFLEASSVTPATREHYGRLLSSFLARTGLTNLAAPNDMIDRNLVSYFETLFLDGKDSGTGSKLLAAVLF